MSEGGAIYSAQRFNEEERARKDIVWKALCRHFFQRYVRADDAVLDVGAGLCEFINNIECGQRFAVDVGEETLRHAAPDVKVYRTSATQMSALVPPAMDLAFCSNFFEHLPDKAAMAQTLEEIGRVLKPAGRLMILQPNIRYLREAYWDFFDHYIPISHASMAEALTSHGFDVVTLIPRFLPFTTKSALPQGRFFIRAYLAFPPVWRVLGKQMFVLAQKRERRA